MYSTQANKMNIKISGMHCNPLFSHMVYVTQFLPLPNAKYNHSVFLYWGNIRKEGRKEGRIGIEGNVLEEGKIVGDAATVEIWELVIRHSLVNPHHKSYNHQ